MIDSILDPRQRGRRRYINKPFSYLPLKIRAVFILYLAGFTYAEIATLLVLSKRDISTAISMGYKTSN